jgi:hypothetical protein
LVSLQACGGTLQPQTLQQACCLAFWQSTCTAAAQPPPLPQQQQTGMMIMKELAELLRVLVLVRVPRSCCSWRQACV